MEKELYESGGLLTEGENAFKKLIGVIIDYLFSADGLKLDADVLTDEPEITKNILESFYERTHNYCQFPKNIIPKWVGKFIINIDNSSNLVGGYYNDMDKLLIEDIKKGDKQIDKLDFTIIINPMKYYYVPDYTTILLTHEFTHAYNNYLELKYNFNLMKDIHGQSYFEIIDTVQQSKFYLLEKSYGLDYVVLNMDVFNSTDDICSYALLSFYMSYKGEIKSFIAEFGTYTEILLRNHKSEIIQSIKESKRLKANYKKLNNAEKFDSNILNNLPVSQYNIYVYRQYKLELLFLKHLYAYADDMYSGVLADGILKYQCLTGIFLGYLSHIQCKIDQLNKKIICEHIKDFIQYIRNLTEPKINETIKKMDDIFGRAIIQLSEEI